MYINRMEKYIMVETLHVVETLHTWNTSQMQKCTNHLSTALDAGMSHTWWVKSELEDQAKNWDQTTKKGNRLRTIKFQIVVSKDVTHGGCMEPAELARGLFKSSIWNLSYYQKRCCQSAALNMPANLENSAVATGLEKVSFHSNPKERQCQRMLKLPHNCTHLTR